MSRVKTYLLDSDVVIWHLRRHPGVADLLERLGGIGRLGVSALTRLEVHAGMRPAEKTATVSFLAALDTYPVSATKGDRAGDLLRLYWLGGATLDLVDASIAATAEIHSLILVTMNARHYPMQGLTLLPMSPDR
jgi:predicted nucleic acid-binding protein